MAGILICGMMRPPIPGWNESSSLVCTAFSDGLETRRRLPLPDWNILGNLMAGLSSTSVICLVFSEAILALMVCLIPLKKSFGSLKAGFSSTRVSCLALGFVEAMLCALSQMGWNASSCFRLMIFKVLFKYLPSSLKGLRRSFFWTRSYSQTS